jgi:hypothetical protein
MKRSPTVQPKTPSNSFTTQQKDAERFRAIVTDSTTHRTMPALPANPAYDNMPQCMKSVIASDIPLQNKHRYQMAAIIVRTARIWNMSYVPAR